jgi:hypothetical protein
MAVFFGLGTRLLARNAVVALKRDARAPIVYLRPFRADVNLADRWIDFFAILVRNWHETNERSLALAVRDLGPLIAIGRPGEHVPPLGAARLYVEDAHWQGVVEKVVEVSRLVILRVGRTDGFRWELEHVTAKCDPRKVVIYLPQSDRDAHYAYLREQWRMPVPLPPDPGDALFLAFGPNWQPHLLHADGGKFRRLLTGSAAPQVRSALKSTLETLGIEPRPAPWHVREWILAFLGLGLVIGVAVLGIVAWAMSRPS